MDAKGETLVVEAPGPRKPLASLPRGRRRNMDGLIDPAVLEFDIETGKQDAGCCVCNIPIPKQTRRIVFKLLLREPVTTPGGATRKYEKYYAHPGCLTDRVRPEVIRSRMDCYDCGAIPEQQSPAVSGLIYHGYRCFTVSKFAAAPLCSSCTKKPRWKQCQACQVFFPHWMIQEAVIQDVPLKHQDQYAALMADLTLGTQENLCEFCAKRLDVLTVQNVESNRSSWEQLREEIRQQGILEAGEHE